MPRLNPQKRLEIALAVLRGEDVAKICAKYGVHQNTVYKIKQEALTALRRGLGGRDSEIARLERENARLKQLVADQALAISLFKKLQSRNRERR